MSTALQRGIVLLGQGRTDLAEREFRQALSDDPGESIGHAFLALCLSGRDQDAEALVEASEAVRLAPASSFVHSVKGRALLGLKRLGEAEDSIREAIRLDPRDAGYRVLLGQVHLSREKPKDALVDADEALALDGQHLGARNLRAMALTQLGRKDEAAATLGEALAEDPEDAFSHTNQGWVALHTSDPDKALVHFREALRLEPNMEWARIGIVEALKAKHLVYRLMLRFFLWIGRQGQIAQWAVILGFVFGRQLLTQIGDKNPALRPFSTPLLVLSLAFLILTWISSPLFSFLLRFNRFGRMALSREETTESSFIGGAVVTAAVCALLTAVTGSSTAFLGMVVAGLMLFPLRVTFQVPTGRPRMIAESLAAGLLVLALPALYVEITGTKLPMGTSVNPGELFWVFVYGSVLSSWLPMILRSRLR